TAEEERRLAHRSEPPDQRARRFLVAIEEGDARALLMECLDDGGADSRGAAGNENGAPREAGITGEIVGHADRSHAMALKTPPAFGIEQRGTGEIEGDRR